MFHVPKVENVAPRMGTLALFFPCFFSVCVLFKSRNDLESGFVFWLDLMLCYYCGFLLDWVLAMCMCVLLIVTGKRMSFTD